MGPDADRLLRLEGHQDVDQRLGPLVPGIILCRAGRACERHGDNADREAACTGLMLVHYGLLEVVVERAAQELRRQSGVAVEEGRSGPGRGRQRRCHDRIVALQTHATRLEQARGME